MTDLLSADPNAPTGFPFPEKIARQKAGLSEEDMRALRNQRLVKDVDFKYHKKAVFLSASALQKIAPLLQASPVEKAQDAPIPEQPTAIAPAAQSLLVVRTDLANRRILLACLEGDNPDRPKKTVRVRVRSTEGFRRRGEIEGRLVPGYQDLYDLVSKYPRKKQTI